MNIIICDDDKDIVEQIQKYVSEFFKSKKIPVSFVTYCNGESLLKDNKPCDIAFIDIEMPGINGLNVAEQVLLNNENAIIFIVTSFQSYLDDAMELKVYRYISKPVDKSRLIYNLECAVEKHYSLTYPVYIENSDEVVRIYTSSILYAAIEDRKTVIYTTQKKFISKGKFEYWKEQLNNGTFSQPHSSFIVNLQYVVDFNKNRVVLQHKDKTYNIYVSQRKYASFKKAFFAYIGGNKC